MVSLTLLSVMRTRCSCDLLSRHYDDEEDDNEYYWKRAAKTTLASDAERSVAPVAHWLGRVALTVLPVFNSNSYEMDVLSVRRCAALLVVVVNRRRV